MQEHSLLDVRKRAGSLAVVLLIAPVGRPAAAAELPSARFPGAGTTVVVNRVNGRLAVLTSDRLAVFENVDAATPLATIELPGKHPEVIEFCGNTLLYSTHEVRNLVTAFVAITTEGRERLAWPNEGLSAAFPAEASHLTLDGKGVCDTLTLDSTTREFFGLPASIPDGARVAATYRFAGENLLARGSEIFLDLVALTPDDMLITTKGGGMMRYRSPGGTAWKAEDAHGNWRITDVDPSGGVVLAIGGQNVLVALGLEKGEPRWRWDATRHAGAVNARVGRTPAEKPVRILDARLLRSRNVLVLGELDGPWLGILDPNSGEIVDGELLARLGQMGMAALSSYWANHNGNLSRLFELPKPEGTTLLLRGADGWYEARMP